MTRTTTINGIVKFAKDECTRLSSSGKNTYSANMKSAVESVLQMVLAKSGSDPKILELAVKVRDALK